MGTGGTATGSRVGLATNPIDWNFLLPSRTISFGATMKDGALKSFPLLFFICSRASFSWLFKAICTVYPFDFDPKVPRGHSLFFQRITHR